MRLLFPALFLAALGCNSDPADPPKPSPAEKPVVSVTALKLVEDYSANALDADRKYKGKTVEVAAGVVAVQKNKRGGYALMLADVRGQFTPYNVVAHIHPDSEKHFAGVGPTLNKLRVVGRVVSAERVEGSHLGVVVVMEDCRAP